MLEDQFLDRVDAHKEELKSGDHFQKGFNLSLEDDSR